MKTINEIHTMIDNLDYHTSIKMLHSIIDLRGNYDNNLKSDELVMLNHLKDWYSANHNEV